MRHDCLPFEVLKEKPELRMLAKMAAEQPCFTNAILAVTEAYKAGFMAAQAADVVKEPRLVSSKYKRFTQQQERFPIRWCGECKHAESSHFHAGGIGSFCKECPIENHVWEHTFAAPTV